MEDNFNDKKPEIDSIKRRLRRIEGQVKGIQRMLDHDACCMDLLIQISAVRAATAKVGMLIFENHVKGCLSEALTGDNKNQQDTLDELMKVMNNFVK